MEISKQLKRARKRAEITQGELADMIGVSRMSINSYERGSAPRPLVMERLLEFIDSQTPNANTVRITKKLTVLNKIQADLVEAIIDQFGGKND